MPSSSPVRAARRRAVLMVLVLAGTGCLVATDPNAGTSSRPQPGGVSVVNAYGSAVDVLVDGAVQTTALNAGDVLVLPSLASGSHLVAVRATGTSATSTVGIIVSSTSTHAIAALRPSPGVVTAQLLSDTNATVPAGSTKMRVLHLAANAGEVQVWRTQPDFATPIRWAFPITYTSINTYYQSTPGDWEVRIWTDTVTYAKGNAAAWPVAWIDRQVVTLAAGQKGTVAVVDKAGGGVKLVRLE